MLVDVASATFRERNAVDGGLRSYFLDVVAPQLPACVRDAFCDAARTQEPVCMPNRRLTAAPSQRRG